MVPVGENKRNSPLTLMLTKIKRYQMRNSGKISQDTMSSPYVFTLPAREHIRYFRKINLISLEGCPFSLPASDWCSTTRQWPEVSYCRCHIHKTFLFLMFIRCQEGLLPHLCRTRLQVKPSYQGHILDFVKRTHTHTHLYIILCQIIYCVFTFSVC